MRMHSPDWARYNAAMPTTINVREVGAAGDGTTMDTAAIQRAIDLASADGGRVVFPDGRYLTGTLTLKSNVTLEITPAATILASSNLADYRDTDWRGSPNQAYNPSEGSPSMSALFLAQGCTNIAITGGGTIDGQESLFAIFDQAHGSCDYLHEATRQGKEFRNAAMLTPDGPVKMRPRPARLMLLRDCTDLRIDNLRIVGAPHWTVHLADCHHVRITRLVLRNDMRLPNNDGVHCTSCQDVVISDCDIIAGDDCLCFTGFGPKSGACSRIVVSNCLLRSRSSAIRIGYGDNDITDLTLANLVIQGSNRGIGLFVRSAGSIRNLRISNVVAHTQLHAGPWWGNGEPLHLSATGEGGVIENVDISGLTAQADHGIILWGGKRGQLRNISVRDTRVRIYASNLQRQFGGNIDLRPADEKREAIFAHGLAALLAHNVSGLDITGFHAHVDDGVPAYLRRGIFLEGCPQALIANTRFSSDADRCGPAIEGENFSGQVVTNLMVKDWPGEAEQGR